MGDMRCEKALDLIYEREENALPLEKEKDLTQHLKGCERCSSEFRKLIRLDEILRKVPEPPVSRTKIDQTIDAVVLEVRGKGGTPASVWPAVARWAAIAAGVLLAAGVGFLAGRNHSIPPDEKTTASMVPDLPGPGSEGRSVLGKGRLDPGREVKDTSRSQEGFLVERLVQGDLALSEAEDPADKAMIFCTMSRDVLSELRTVAGCGEPGENSILGQGYVRLILEGVLPNLVLADGSHGREKISKVVVLLKCDCESLKGLVTRAEGRELDILAEALTVAIRCRKRAEEVMSE